MAGSPLKRRATEILRARAVAQLGEDADILDLACDWIASGRSISALAQDISREIGAVSRPLLSSILNNAAPDASDRLNAARREGASALVEIATQIADDTEATTAAVMKARLQVGTRQWLAERMDAASYGQKGTTVNINVGALMLDALRQPPPIAEISAPTPVAALGAGEDVDYETLTGDIEP